VDGSATRDVVPFQKVIPPDTGKVELTFCRSCGTAVVVGREDDHEVLHQ
jgi:hypothetical protein